MIEKMAKKKPFWRTSSEYNPALSSRQALLIGAGFLSIFVLLLAPFFLNILFGVDMGIAYIVILGSFAAFVVLLEVTWLVLLAIGLPREVRRSNALWRKRMASGFYKTLPPWKDDEDD